MRDEEGTHGSADECDRRRVFSRLSCSDNASPSTFIDVPVTEGVLANSLAKVAKLLDSTTLIYAIPLGFGPQLVRWL